MRIDPIQLTSKQSMFYDYKYNYQAVSDRFAYSPYEAGTWEERLSHLKNQTYPREGLADVLHEMNVRWQAPEQSLENIGKLRDEDSVVVIAGQQAGLLTGPLYSVHKIISVLQLAKQKEKALGKPVIPVFWLAGEDHDFDEINHVMMKNEGRMKKMTIDHIPETKASVSDIAIDQEKAPQWLRDVFLAVNETEYTQDFYLEVQRLLTQSETYSDFFAKLVYALFPDEGLVIVDAHDPSVRAIESPYFKTMINQNEKMAQGVYAALQKNRQQGYETLLDSEMEDAHLFYHRGIERILLTRDEEGDFRGKHNEVAFTKEELLQVAEESPEQLSNNVVTRPLMQEALFPVLAFIGGPGEINYWSALKPAFDAADLRMPPVLPRISFTLVDRKTEQSLEKFQIEANQAIRHGVAEQKLKWVASMSYPPIEQLSRQVKHEIARVHAPIREKSADFGADLEQLADKNLQYLLENIDFMEKRLNQSLEERHQYEMDLFDDIELTLHPLNGLQERVWGIVPWINQYGKGLFQQMNRHDLSFEHDHYVVYL
ncbi:bacillithiol biosynthesis cysteine-adding enzyme BshC [Halobacillus litoralis]|uniref:Putative cysteine ligase BshC n=1 Tax=Halobacillus litoralis TaxID=45668 RepID=A0A410M8R3_9BACI|nr:bacillithiol biosynthesis cysteine-adding enzyme BshC [Halobacillus litoralis]QAS51105.1 bacillithiol biosynthesis cysteine-adding enzyme BshC [Halobacillus litoralis]